MRARDGGWQGRRFAVTVLGGVVVSLVVLALLLATTTTPDQARAERAIPELTPPTTKVTAGSRVGSLAVPEGALVTDEETRTWVTVWRDDGPHKIEVRQVRSDLPKLVEVTGSGLKVGDLVELISMDDADSSRAPGGA